MLSKANAGGISEKRVTWSWKWADWEQSAYFITSSCSAGCYKVVLSGSLKTVMVFYLFTYLFFSFIKRNVINSLVSGDH